MRGADDRSGVEGIQDVVDGRGGDVHVLPVYARAGDRIEPLHDDIGFDALVFRVIGVGVQGIGHAPVVLGYRIAVVDGAECGDLVGAAVEFVFVRRARRGQRQLSVRAPDQNREVLVEACGVGDDIVHPGLQIRDQHVPGIGERPQHCLGDRSRDGIDGEVCRRGLPLTVECFLLQRNPLLVAVQCGRTDLGHLLAVTVDVHPGLSDGVSGDRRRRAVPGLQRIQAVQRIARIGARTPGRVADAEYLLQLLRVEAEHVAECDHRYPACPETFATSPCALPSAARYSIALECNLRP
ncbi:hypothetical protein [Nocardia pseudobrasiliensis]|uniref:hypothetical protein n=1 Tax=Nocardia pseudobrasiliensis TaxID=45979 RepID=UPI0011C017BC|nr:hypothetical protein [Nocardia pseudobrasiliensis]